MRRRRRRLGAPRTVVAVTLAAAVTLALAGCDTAAGPRPAPSATALPQGITATLLPSTVPGEALVRVSNGNQDTFTIDTLRLLDARFAWAGRTGSPRDRSVPASTTTLVPVILPDARCEAARGEGTRLRVEYELGASIAVASAIISDPAGVVAALVAAECAS